MAPWPEETPRFLDSILTVWRRCGWIGVDLFFVLSGFLVSGLLFREYSRYGNIQIGRFLARRGLKIYPAFYVMLVTTIAVDIWSDKPQHINRYIIDCLFLQSYFQGVWIHTWTLAVEEHFYLFLAFLIFILATRARDKTDRPFDSLPRLFFCSAIAILTARCVTAIRFDYHHAIHMFPSHLRMDSLFFGVLLSYLYHFHSEEVAAFTSKFRFQLLASSLLMLSWTLFLPLGSTLWIHTFGLNLLYIGFGFVVVSTVDWEPHRLLVSNSIGRLLAGVGFYSYSIYLWHLPVQKYGPRAIETVTGIHTGYWPSVIMYLTGSILLGILMAKLVEIPFLKIRDRYFPSRSKGSIGHGG